MDGYIQTAIGIAVSILLFWLSYRQTIGAKKERTKNANKSLHRAIMRRMVLEDYKPKYKDISRIIEGKAREFNTSSNDMLSEEQVLNSVFSEVFDSDLISPSQRIEIESRLDELFAKIEEQPSEPSIHEFKELNEQNKKKRDLVIMLTVIVSTIGASTSVLYSFIQEPTSFILANSDWLFSGIGVFVISTAMITLMSIVRKEKEESSLPTRNSAYISAAAFELDVAKVIEKSGYKYLSEPQIGNFKADFVIEANGKKIIVEAKAWGDVIPLSSIKRTIDQLEKISQAEDIDSVILVAKKLPPIKGINIENSKVKAYSMNEFSSLLKNKKIA